MKRLASIVLVVAGALLLPGLVFAQSSGKQNGGTQNGQTQTQNPDMQGMPGGPRGHFEDFMKGGTAKTLNGVVSVKGRIVTIKAEGKTYQLVSPPGVFEDINLSDGTSVSLEGQLFTDYSDPWVKSDGLVFVRTITFGGKNYDLVALGEAKWQQMGPRGPGGPGFGGPGFGGHRGQGGQNAPAPSQSPNG